MSLIWTASGVAGVAALSAFALRAKLRRDAVRQDGQVVGSALYGGEAGEGQALFVMLRGERGFQADAPFEHGRGRYLLLSYEAYDDSSPVLRRFSMARCQRVG